jgi:hypothetical protein
MTAIRLICLIAITAAVLGTASCNQPKQAATPNSVDTTIATPPTVSNTTAADVPAAAVDPLAIPKLPDSYWQARGVLLQLGFMPIAASEPYKGCLQEMLTGKPVEGDCPRSVDLPEIDSCSGSGQAFCIGYWRSPDGRTLNVTTAGEPQPGAIFSTKWEDSRPKSNTNNQEAPS